MLAPVVDSATSVLSESVFLFLASLLTCAIVHLSRSDSKKWAVVLVVVLGAACLCRYLGVALAAGTGLALLATSTRPLRERCTTAVALPALAVLPLSAWLLRNHHAAGSFTADDYGTSNTSFLTHVRLDLQGVGGWWTGTSGDLLSLAAGLVTVAVLVMAVIRRNRPAQTVAILIGTYLALVLLAQSLVGLDTDDRFLRPAAPLLPLLMVTLCSPMRGPVRGLPNLATIAVVPVAAASLISLATLRSTASDDGLGDYDAAQWRHSATIAALRARHPTGALVSNDAYAISLLTGAPVLEAPTATYDDSTQTTGELQQFARDARTTPITLVWFDNPDIGGLEPLDRLKKASCLQLLKRYSDAAVYRSCP